MKEINTILILGLSLALSPMASALDILIVTNTGPESDSLENFLTDTEGHTVTRETRRTGPGDASAFDLIIVARNTASGEYSSNSAEWNAVTAPIILMNPYFLRTTHWGWITSTSTGIGGNSDGFDAPYPDPNHSFLTTLAIPTETVFTASVTTRRTIPDDLLASGTTTVATSDTGTTSAIFTIESGTVLSDPSATPAGNLRIAWPIEGLAGWDDINSNGEQILRNMIDAVTDSPLDEFLITGISFEAVSGDLLVNFTPGGSNYALKASNDLLSAFEEVVPATLENEDTTFRIPAANLHPSKEFFLIERNP